MKKRPQYSEEEPLPGTKIVRSGAEGNPRIPLMVATPSLGIVRIEWAITRYQQVIPCNWSNHEVTVGVGSVVPMHYLVADGQNIATADFLKGGYGWLLLIEDDTIAPPDLFTLLDEYIRKETIPVVSGLYFLKTPRSEPILYRGRGTRCFRDFKLGDKVWVDGVPTGMLLIHRSLLELMSKESQPYETLGGRVVPKVWETPSAVTLTNGQWNRRQGTSDLAWCHRVIKEKVLARAGWKKIGARQYPFLCDTNIFCRHIDLSTGRQYPPEEILKQYRR